MSTHRWAAWLAGVWAGVLACIGAMAAPAAFTTLMVTDAGRFAGRLFAEEAYLSLALAVLLLALLRIRRATDRAGSAMTTDTLLLFGTIFCTVAGYFAVQPLMAAARAGEGQWSFAALHAVSGGLFVLKGILIALLAWRLAPRGPRPINPAAIS